MLLGTVTGMSMWSILYASLGGASRSLLEGGADLEVLLEGAGPAESVILYFAGMMQRCFVV
jgi:hypothetical protein